MDNLTDGYGSVNNNNLGDGSNHSNIPAWMAQNPDDLKSNEVLAKNQTIGDLSRNYLDLYGKQETAIQLPGENATDEDRATFFTKLGRPEKPDGYQLDEVQWPENYPDYIKTLSKEDTEFFKKVAHEIGLTDKQAKSLHTKSAELAMSRWADSQKAQEAMKEKTVQALRSEWGGQYDENLTVAKRGFLKAGELAGVKDEFVQLMNDSKLGDNPMFIKVFHAIGKAISDDTALDAGSGQHTQERDVPRGPDGRPRLRFPSMEK